MRVVRWILIAAAALVLLAALALVTLTLAVNPDRYRAEIERLVSRDTGRPFVIEGHLRITWFPWLGVRMGAARLGAPPGERGPDLIDWRSARLSVRLLPLLLHRRLVIGPIRLNGAVIHLWREPDGRGNWQDLLAHASAGSSALPVVGGLTLTDGALYFQTRGKPLSLTRWRLRISAWEPGEPLTVGTRFVLRTAPLPPAGVPVALHVRGVRLQLTPLRVSVPAASVRIADATIQGAATMRRAQGGLRGAGHVALAVPSVRGLLGLLGIRMRLPRSPTALETLALSGRFQLKDGAVAVHPFSGRLDATTLSGWVDRSGGPQPRWTFALAADRIDLDRYLPPTRKRSRPFALPVQALRALHARGTLTIARATLKGTVMQDVRLQVR